MTERSGPTIPGGVMPIHWDETPHGLRIAISPVDEFGLPFAKRGFATAVPRGAKETLAFADEVAKVVRDTVLLILTADRPAA